MKKLAILGASGHGKVVAEAAELCGWKKVVFFDDAWPNKIYNGDWEVKGDTEALMHKLSDFDGVIVAIGNNQIRHDKMLLLQQANAPVVTIIHPSATVSAYATIACGTVVLAQAVVNTGVNVGEAVILNTACTVDHDCRLANAVHISPGVNLAGGVSIEEKSWIGIGACIKQDIKVGCLATVGAGSVVVKNILDDQTWIGNPAKIMEKKC